MENKCKRFLSLLLALVMVIGMMPMGQARAEESGTASAVKVQVMGSTSEVKLDDCLYTFTSTGAKNKYTITSTLANGAKVYVCAYGGGARPNQTGEQVVTLDAGVNAGMVYFKNDDGKSLHFHSEAAVPYWNQCSSAHTGNATTGTHELMLFAKTDGDGDIVIPGYRQISSYDAVESGKQYLIVGKNNAGNYYVMRPTNSNKGSEHMAQVFATEVPLAVNGTATFRVDGDYTDADTTALNKSVATVGMNGYTRYDVTGVANGVTTIVSGHQYVIFNHRALTDGTGHAPILSNENKNNGLKLVHNAADTTVWTITENVNGTYAVKDKDGNYLTLTNGSNNTASVSATACDLTLIYRNNSYWTIGAGNSNLNAHGGTSNERAAGYAADNSHTDGGSFWLLYDVTATLESGSYVISHRTNGKTVTGKDINAGDYGYEGGSGLAVSGNINHVVDADLWNITAVEGGYYVQNGQNEYLTIAKGTATFTATPTKLSLVNNGRTWAIGDSTSGTTYYLNDFGNKGAAAAGWSTLAGADGSQWTLYKVTGSVPATAITFTGVGAGTSAVRIGEMTYTAHIHGNSSIVDAVKPTLCEPGHTGKTVCVCGEILSEGEVITQLPVATVLEGNKLVALNACEYTLKLESTQNGKNLYSLSHGDYYVNPSANNVPSIPQATEDNQLTSKYKELELHWQDVNEGQGNAVHIIGNGGLHFWSAQNVTQSGATNSKKNYWDRCSGNTDNPEDREHDLYLFRATGVGTGDVIPGYTKVTKDDVTPGESYLIAGVCDGAWFVMHPSGDTKKLDHVAKVESQLHTAAHPWNDATFSDPKICSRCGATEGDPIAPKNAKPLMDNWQKNNRGVVSLSDCEYVLSGTGNGSYSLCNSGFYYVNPDAAKGTGIPQQITPCAGLTLNITDGKVEISGSERKLQVNNTANAVNLVGDTKYHPWWHDFDATPSSSKTGFYLLKANPNSTNVNIPGYDIVTEVAVGESYLIAFENAANEWFVMYPSTETVALAMLTKSAGEFEISYANISMENDLEMCFAFEADLVDDWQGCYAVIEKQYADGRDPDTQTVLYSDWESEKIKSVAHNYVIYKGVAAKEMTDQLSVTIYNANNEPISMTHNDSIKEYALRVLKDSSSDPKKVAYKKVVVDMLNYGAAAQNAFGYNNAEENLANYGLTEAQKALGTSDPVQYDNELNLDECPVDYMANVKMVSNLQFMMAFSGINETMYAEVTFYHWNGVDIEEITIKGENFVESGRFHYFTIDKTVVADGRQPITCVIKDAEGKTVAEVTDSIASYAGRTQSNKPLYEAIVKFSDSAKAYLRLKNG